jgi:hypothetical protein
MRCQGSGSCSGTLHQPTATQRAECSRRVPSGDVTRVKLEPGQDVPSVYGRPRSEPADLAHCVQRTHGDRELIGHNS